MMSKININQNTILLLGMLISLLILMSNAGQTFFPEDALAATIKSVDDYEDIAKGTRLVMGKFAGGLDEFENAVKAATKEDAARILKNIGKLLGKQTSQISQTLTKKFKTAKEFDEAILGEKHGAELKKLFKDSSGGIKSQRQSVASYAAISENLPAKVLLTEKGIEDIVGKGSKQGADYVSEIARSKAGVSVKTIEEGVKDIESISRPIIKGAEDLAEVRKAAKIWDTDVVHVLVKEADYEKAKKILEQIFSSQTKLKELVDKGIELDKLRVVITKVDNFIVGG